MKGIKRFLLLLWIRDVMGVGDHRPEFGRFEVVEFKVIK